MLSESLDPSYDKEDSEYFSELNLLEEYDVLNELPPLIGAQAKKKISSPSGSLRVAIEEALKQHGKPMKAAQIFEVLQERGYIWVSEEPIGSVYWQLRKMVNDSKAVKVSDNRYALADMKITPAERKSTNFNKLKRFFYLL